MLTKFKDSECLVQALEDVGLKNVEVHDDAQPLFGIGGDYRLASNWDAHTRDPELAQKAHVIVRKKDLRSAANDLGFERMEDGAFRCIVSGYDRSWNNEAWLAKVTQRYNVALDKKKVKAMGYQVLGEKTLANGDIVIRAGR